MYVLIYSALGEKKRVLETCHRRATPFEKNLLRNPCLFTGQGG